ncbi:MAG: DUF814 domain-containing protein [Candidatus Kapaibacterium sp.]|nr:MAG: DUF814 domain-containing protein [Candidatus Kapabacteria bacterium]
MQLHYYTLHHIAREITARAGGAFLTECFTQEKNTLHLVFEQAQRKQSCVVECHFDSRNGAVFCKDNFSRARKNTLNCFPELIGRTLESAEMLAHERIMLLHLPPYTLHCIVFAGWNALEEHSSANAICTHLFKHDSAATLSIDKKTDKQPEQRIITSFRASSALADTPFQVRTSPLRQLALFAPETSIHAALAQAEYGLGKLYAEEVLARLGVAGAEMLGASDIQDAIEDISLVAEDVRNECLSASEYAILRKEITPSKASRPNKPFVSVLHLTQCRVEARFTSVSEAIQECIRMNAREARFHEMYAATEERVRFLKEKAERAHAHIKHDTDGGARAMERQLWAELLLSQANINHKGVSALDVPNWDGEIVHIPLQAALSLRENAEDFFAKAARAKDSRKRRTQREGWYASEIKRLEQLYQQLSHATTEQDCERIMSDVQKNGQKNSPNTPSHQKTTRFREFPLDESHTLYVGKTASDNDELTVRFAKPQDYWFHARGVPGSHAVLRINGNSQKQKLPKIVLEQAAAIAAYFSKARNAKLAPVAYTQKKYVRKPKGAAVGAVVMEREEVVMVRPHVPEGLLGSIGEDSEM